MTTPDPGAAATGPELTDAQRAWLAQQTAQQVTDSPSPAAAQAATAAQLAGAERGPELPAETDMDRLMALFKAQAEQLAGMRDQLVTLQRAEAERSAASGGPLIVRYARAVRDYLHAHAAQHPDLGTMTPATVEQPARVSGHFETVTAHADALVTAAEAAADGHGDVGAVEQAAGKIGHWIERGHAALSGKHIDFGAIAQALEYVGAEAVKLAA